MVIEKYIKISLYLTDTFKENILVKLNYFYTLKILYRNLIEYFKKINKINLLSKK